MSHVWLPCTWQQAGTGDLMRAGQTHPAEQSSRRDGHKISKNTKITQWRLLIRKQRTETETEKTELRVWSGKAFAEVTFTIRADK